MLSKTTLALSHLKDPTSYFLCQVLPLATIISLYSREKGSLFIYAVVVARILPLIAVLDSPLQYRMSLRRLLKVMEHNDVSERPLKLRSGVGQCEHSAT